ncbi:MULTISPECIES: TonB-dependent siderophore receptor [Roseobacteraceae]|uniref:Ferrichrome-iron receptor n=1 Tax=Pseudosulfitobacter pseudonitzschiae TaxID=1402135 RepID=A0A221JWJ6_9RHOB|nr:MULTISPECIES: TonB-dependent siderophore receptor [Roseobacteraceae]ASM71000.1 ferrichrome-iron receptor [Pseudosulfitobacter pseudonitzschiae]
MTYFAPRRFSLNCILAGCTALSCVTLAVQTAQAQDAEPMELPSILLRYELDYSGRVDGYLAPATETGVKSGVPLSEVPQSISVVTSTELETRSPDEVENAIAYVPGINPSTWGTDDRFDQFSIRGFDMGSSALYRDGLPQKVLSFSAFSTDPFMIDRIDVLRGPAGVLYGSNDAGGMVNLVTKRPVFDRLAEGRLSYGSHNTAEAGFDWSDTISADGTMAARVTGLQRDGETEVDSSANDRAFLSGGFTWAPSDNTTFTLLGHIQRDAKTPIIMSPVAGEDFDASLGALPGDFAYRQSDYNHFKTTQESLGWELTHRFSEGLTYNQRVRFAHQETDYAHLDYTPSDATSGLTYYAFRNDEDARTIGFDNNVEWETQLFGADNSVIAGIDYQYSRSSVTQYYDGTIYTLPISDPKFDFIVTDPALSSRSRTTYRETGIYAQDHLKFANGTAVTAGVRYSWFDNEAADLLTGSTSSQSDNAATGMFGVTHEFANGLTPYIGYSEGFIQNVGTTISGETLDPSKSRQWETGLRYQPSNNLMLSGALFDLRKTNVKDYDLADRTFSSFTQVGEVRSRGFELEARGQLTADLQGILSYSYLDSEITKSSDASKLGNSNAMAPSHQLALWLDYDASAFVQGLTVGAGIRYSSDSFSTQDNGRITPSHTIADMSMTYAADNFNVNLNVSNLFDRDYYGVCYDGYGCVKGEGRIIKMSLSRQF